MTGSAIHKSTAVIDNGPFGKVNIRFETGRLAQQAGGAVQAFLDDETMVLSATTAGKEPKDSFDFFPLTIDVEEKMYALGKIPIKNLDFAFIIPISILIYYYNSSLL